MAGEDPNARAVMMLERDRQLREYDAVLSEIHEGRLTQALELKDYWATLTGHSSMRGPHFTWLTRIVGEVPATVVKEAMWTAYSAGKTNGLQYVMVVIRNKREAVTHG